MEAIFFQASRDGKQREVCWLRIVDGKVVASNNNPTGRYILGRSILDYSSSRPRELTVDDGEEFLKALPAAYSGTLLRVGLDE